MTAFAHRNSCMHEAWKNASPEIHQHVMEYKNLSEMSIEQLEGMEIVDKENRK